METDKEKSAPEKLPSFSSKDQNDNKDEKDEKQDQKNDGNDTTNDNQAESEEAKAEETEKNDDEEHPQPAEEQVDIEQVPDLNKVSEEIDQFVSVLSSASPPPPKEVTTDEAPTENEPDQIPQIPDYLEQFAFLVEAKVANYDSFDTPVRWSQLPEEDTTEFLQNVDRVSKLFASLSKFSSHSSDYASSINRIGGILQRALSFLEEEFRLILEDYKFIDPNEDSKAKQNSSSPSSEANNEDGDNQSSTENETAPPDPDAPELETNFPGFSQEIVPNLKKTVDALISGGHQTECCQIYFIERRKALEQSLQNLGFEKCSIDDVQKKSWESLERDIVTWIKTFKELSNTILPSERKLIGSVFTGQNEPASTKIFGMLWRGLMIQLLNFSEAVAMTKRSAEKLFKFLDVYETLRDLTPALDQLFPSDCVDEIKSEASLTRSRLGEAIICIFCELENSIKADTGKTPVAGGAVHPLARYIMNYLKYACEYKDTLEQVFKQHQKIERADSVTGRSDAEDPHHAQHSQQHKDDTNHSPFQIQLAKVMDLLDSNLDTKSKLYKDTSLSLIFLMNNGRYILQKIKGSAEIKSILGETWCRKRSSDLRAYHKNYQRETWGKLLNCISMEGLIVNGKVVKPVLKEKFKSFNAMFDEIHKTQCTWVVSDEQLQSELRVSISAVVIPAYRSFMARFASTFTPGRQTEKYIKYQPEDIETYIEELFDGSSASALGKRR